MMYSKKYLTMMTAFAMAMATTGTEHRERQHEQKESDEEKRIRLLNSEKKIALSNGLKEFTYGEKRLFASNQKVADEKANKRGWNAKEV